MISANGGLPAHRYTPQVTPRWPRSPKRLQMLPPTLSTVSDPSTPRAGLLALLAVPHSAMSVGAAWNRVATSVWWLVVEAPVVELRYTM